MGKSHRAPLAMRFLWISLLASVLAVAVHAEDFKKEKIQLGKKKCLCDFSLDIGEKCKGTAKCDKKCSGSGDVELGGCSFTLAVKKGKGKISKCSCEAASTEPTTGSGSGETPVPITGSGSGETPVPISGSGAPPAGGEGMQCSCKCDCPDGSGECDCDCNCPMTSKAVNCAPGFSKVCPMMGDACPQDMEPICPNNAMSRMAGGAGDGRMADKGCQCVPDFLMDMVKIQPLAPAGRMTAVDRAITKATIQVGKKKCKCSYEMNAKDCKKSKITCDKKCSGKASGVELEDGMYMLDIAVKKGKVTIAKCDVQAAPAPTGSGGGSGGMGSGSASGNGGGGMGGMGSRCACVSMGMGGTGPVPPPGSGSGIGPTGSGSGTAPTGSGSGSVPTGSGSGPATILPPTGSGSGSGSVSPTPTPSDCQCGLAKRKTKIVGGKQTEVNEYPWQVGIVNKGQTSVFCGASLISDRWILSAAHCFHDESSATIQVLLGEHDYSSVAESDMLKRNIEKIVDHPNYDKQTSNYDFSLMKLSEPIDFSSYPHIRPICLPENDDSDYANFVSTVTGWGTTSLGGSTSSKLLEVDVNVMTNSECQNNYAYPSSWITDQMLCAIVEGGGKDACQGDSGGPLVTAGAGNGVVAGQNYEQIGVVSWGSGCAGADSPGVYSRVTEQLGWITTTTAGAWSTCPRN